MSELIIVRPAELLGRAGWEAWEDEQVKPFFAVRRVAIDYAILRGNNGARRLEVRDAEGAVVRAIEGPALRELAEKRSGVRD